MNFKEKLAVILEVLRLLRLADFTTLEHAIAVCFVTNPQREQLSDLLRILLAARFVRKEPQSPYFRVDGEVRLLDIENVNIEQAMAQVTLFYERHADHVFNALAEARP